MLAKRTAGSASPASAGGRGSVSDRGSGSGVLSAAVLSTLGPDGHGVPGRDGSGVDERDSAMSAMSECSSYRESMDDIVAKVPR